MKITVETLIEVAEELRCDLSCVPCSYRESCYDSSDPCPPCRAYALILSLAAAGGGGFGGKGGSDRTAANDSRSVGYENFPITTPAVREAVDRIDRMLEDFYTGRKKMDSQNYTEIGRAMEIVYTGFKEKGKKARD